MQTREIEHEAWDPFFNDFTKLYQNRRINVETIADDGAEVRSHLSSLPLVGIVVAVAGDKPEKRIEVIARDPHDGVATHEVTSPSKVRVGEEHGQAVALQVESANGTVTVIRFEPSRENMPEGFMVAR